MRFHKDGPNIPDKLLEQRDLGRVVFVCGAGVSLGADMPSFYTLTKQVIDFFDPPEGSAIESAFKPWIDEDNDREYNRKNNINNTDKKETPKTPLDQIFNLLYNEYGRDEVNAKVTLCLIYDDSAVDASYHKIIARLSSDTEGKPQIVTTNFDTLFETAIDTKTFHEPPAFPDISLGMPITGITYLHGRLKDTTDLHPSYVLSSADFGRAYLSEAWATNFILSLLKNYTVVLVGYQAEDPPVKYLLQGLNHDGLSDRSNLYAFDRGEPEDIEAKWRDRGVTAIACKSYPLLKGSLEAWATRADDPRQWRLRVMELASKSPRQLSSHERGQVVHLVRTTAGASLFIKTQPSPPPEWLCVFDAGCRIVRANNAIDEPFDPFTEYALDDDTLPSEQAEDPAGQMHDHLLEWRRGDSTSNNTHRLAGYPVGSQHELPKRLDYLARWIAQHINSPIVAWWATHQYSLHPRLLHTIKLELDRNTNLHNSARHYWNLVLELHADNQNLGTEDSWFHIEKRVNTENWTSSVLRQIEIMAAPTLCLDRPSGAAAQLPPLGSWDETAMTEVATWSIKFPSMHRITLAPPDQVLQSVYRIAELHLRRAAELLLDINTAYFLTPTCYPQREANEEHDNHETFYWFLQLFQRMVATYPLIATAYATCWPSSEPFYFRGLKLFALNQSTLFTADEAATNILALSQEYFWDGNITRELLFLIADRWEEFTTCNQAALLDRLLKGPNKEEWQNDERKYLNYRNKQACRYIHWLIQHGVTLTINHKQQLDELTAKIPEWNDSWTKGLTEESQVTIHSIAVDHSPDRIANLPIDEIANKATAESQHDFSNFTENRPFSGLAQKYPRKALAALSVQSKKQQYPFRLWAELINHWPQDIKPRLFKAFLYRLERLPYETIRKIPIDLGRWLEKEFTSMLALDNTLAWRVLDHCIAGIASHEGVASTSGIGESRRGGKTIPRSRKTYQHAINGPIGKMTQGLLHALNATNVEGNRKIPSEFKARLEQLIRVKGEGGHHAAATITKDIGWLYSLDAEWLMATAIPWFNFDHLYSEAAWNGYLYSQSRMHGAQEVDTELKPLILELFPRIYQWQWDQEFIKMAVNMTIDLAVFRKDEPDTINAQEARRCLRQMNDQSRQSAVFRLSQIGQFNDNRWSNDVMPFINNAWPKERVYKTSSLASSWVSLLAKTGQKFPEVLNTIRSYLTPTAGDLRLYPYRQSSKKGNPLAAEHPKSVLELLNLIVSDNINHIPYDLSEILKLIEETNSNLANDRRFMRLNSLVVLS